MIWGLFPNSSRFYFAFYYIFWLWGQYNVKLVRAFFDGFNFNVIRENYTQCLLDRSFRVGKQFSFKARVLPCFFNNLRLKESS